MQGAVRGAVVGATAAKMVVVQLLLAASAAAAGPSTAVIGAGPAGLATSIMLARRGATDIHVYERLSAPASSDDSSVWSDTAKFYLIGLGGRGQKALQELDAWAQTERCCTYVLGRKDWAPGAGADEGVERIFGDDRPYKTAVIPRDRLAGVLRETILDEYADAVTLHYETELKSVRWDDDGAARVTLQATCPAVTEGAAATSEALPCERRYELLIGADGAARTLASAMEDDAREASRSFDAMDGARRPSEAPPISALISHLLAPSRTFSHLLAPSRRCARPPRRPLAPASDALPRRQPPRVQGEIAISRMHACHLV